MWHWKISALFPFVGVSRDGVSTGSAYLGLVMNCKLFAVALLVVLPLSRPALADDGAAAPLPTVSVVAAASGPIAERLVVTGTLVAREQVFVSAGVDGLKIESLGADVGDRVTEGAVLARLAVDTIDVQLAQNTSQIAAADAQIAQAEAQILAAEANARQAAAALERAKTLTAKGVSAQDVLDQRLAGADSADAQLAVARQTLVSAKASRHLMQAQRDELQLRRSKTEIKAPRTGLVLARNALVGQVAGLAGGALFVLAEDGDIELAADVPEVALPRLAVGQPVAVLPAGLTQAVEGRVRLIAPEIDATTRLGRLRIALPSSTGLHVGSFARGTVEIARSTGLLLPVSAVNDSDGQKTVQVVDGGVVATRTVTVGLSDAGRVEITSGLAPGDLVVSRAGTFLRDGDHVKPLLPAATEEAKG